MDVVNQHPNPTLGETLSTRTAVVEAPWPLNNLLLADLDHIDGDRVELKRHMG